MRWNTYCTLMVASTAFFLMAALAVYWRLLDFIAADGKVDEALIGSLVAYWLLSIIGIFLVFRGRQRWREILLLVCTVLVTLVVVELGLRIFNPPAAMPEFHGISSRTYHHLLPKNAEMNAGIFDGKGVIVRTNEDGLRSLYSREAFRAFKTRIAFLGDSFPFENCVRQEFAFPAVAERLLREQLAAMTLRSSMPVSTVIRHFWKSDCSPASWSITRPLTLSFFWMQRISVMT